MGLWIQSLENIPPEAKRDYFIYLLDYGWDEPLGEALMKNYQKMAAIAADNQAVVIRGTRRIHFEDEVLSWHSINGENAEEILPAILITNANPHSFKENHSRKGRNTIRQDLKLVLIPLKKFCTTTTEVVALTEKLFNDIKGKKKLSEFRIGRRIQKNARSLADSLILEPANNKESITMAEVITFLKDFSDKTAPFNAIKINRTVHPIHFEDMSGQQFERLIFAFVLRLKQWNRIQWLGQTGGDGGRDIWGIANKETYCYQCANYSQLTLKKIADDIDKLVKGKTIPDYFTVVCSSKISPDMRSKISSYAAQNGILNTEIWSGAEVEEKLRQDAPDLLKRFIEGEVFPGDPAQSTLNEREQVLQNDNEILESITQCFDRPAFTTSFRKRIEYTRF